MLYASVCGGIALFGLKDLCGGFCVARLCFATLLWVCRCLAWLSALTVNLGFYKFFLYSGFYIAVKVRAVRA
jgi:hypothetical protein